MTSVIQNFLYEASDCTHEYLAGIPTRYCLCSSPRFATDLLAEDTKNDAIEWAQNQTGRVTRGQINSVIHQSGHVLTAIFVPITCSLSVHVASNQIKELTYYFDSDFNADGCKYSLFIPLICCSDLRLRAVVEVSNKYENKDIPLTFFYINLKVIHHLYNKVVDHIEKKFLIKSINDVPARLTFVTKGRFNPDNYQNYIHGKIQTAVLGNFEIVSLYTFERKNLGKLLSARLVTFVILD